MPYDGPRFPPWSVEEQAARFVVRDHIGQAIASFTLSLAVAASIDLLFLGRGRNGDALPFLQKGIAAYLFAIVIFALFVGGLEGAAVNLGWLR